MAERETAEDERSVACLESIRVYNARLEASNLITTDLTLNVPEKADSRVVHADGFGSVLSHVLPCFATMLGQMFDVVRYEYSLIEKLNGIYDKLRPDVLGQDEGKSR